MVYKSELVHRLADTGLAWDKLDKKVAALREKNRQLSVQLANSHEERSVLQAALDKAETKYAASSTAADELLDNWKHRADKAERTLSEKVSAAEARIKELEEGVHEIAEEVLGCSAPCSLDVRAKCKELEARLAGVGTKSRTSARRNGRINGNTPGS